MRAIKINGTKVKIWARSLDIYGWEQVMYQGCDSHCSRQ